MRHKKKRVNGELNAEVYKSVFENVSEIAEEIARVSGAFPEQRNYLANLVRRNSQLVCSNLEEAWYIRENETRFLEKLSDAAQAASRTQDILKLASRNHYLDEATFRRIDAQYESIFEDIFLVLCNGKRQMNHPEVNSKRQMSNANAGGERMHSYGEFVSVS